MKDNDNDNDAQVHQPWDALEFGQVAPTTSPATEKARHHSDHVENLEPGESVWEALKSTAKSTTVNDLEKQTSSDTASLGMYDLSDMSLPRMTTQVLAAAQSEHRMSFKTGIKMYPRAILWAGVISLAIVGEGYDTALISSLYAFDTFQHAYGVPANNGTYQITTKWQSLFSNGPVIGTVFGLLLNGWLTERLGYRRTLMFALVMICAFVFPVFFANDVRILFCGQVLLGLPWGMCSTLAVTYASEVMPLALRGHLIANINTCWIIGQIIALGTLRGSLGDPSRWSFRTPFALQWVWAVIVFFAAWAAPESPWWLIRKGRFEDAKKVLLRLGSDSPEFNADDIVAMMKHTNEVEKQLNNGKAIRNDISYLECFRGTNLRRTETACAVFMCQGLVGLPLISFAAYFYKQIGFNEYQGFDLTLGMHGLAFCACMVALVLMRRIGRRVIYLTGIISCAIILLCAAIIGTLKETKSTLWAQAALVFCMITVFDMSLGPVTYALVAEIPSTRLRINTVILARISFQLCGVVTNILQFHSLNPLSWDLAGKTSWIWFGMCILPLIYCYFRVPETKGLTYHELDILFEKKAPARKFADIQKRLQECGYFGMDDNRGSMANARWR